MEKTVKKVPTRRAAPPPQQAAPPPPDKRPQRRAGDHVQAWQQAKLDPTMWPFPAPVHGKAGLTWAVLPTGEKVKWTDLGMDRRLDERLKFWEKAGQKVKQPRR